MLNVNFNTGSSLFFDMIKTSLIHLTNLLSIYHVSGAILDNGNIVVSKTVLDLKKQTNKKTHPTFWQ